MQKGGTISTNGWGPQRRGSYHVPNSRSTVETSRDPFQTRRSKKGGQNSSLLLLVSRPCVSGSDTWVSHRRRVSRVVSSVPVGGRRGSRMTLGRAGSPSWVRDPLVQIHLVDPPYVPVVHVRSIRPPRVPRPHPHGGTDLWEVSR